jgi:alkylhydroperoxidase/carboxymuconolactone decarboxylase family protein YurZ
MANKQQNQAVELAALKKRTKHLERELARKDKALAELAVLLALKKKLELTLGVDEDD